MPPLKSNVKCELSTLANKIKTMSLNLWKTVNAQQEIVNKNVELLQQNISYLQKEHTSKNKTIKSLLEVHSALIKSLIKPIVNDFRVRGPTMEPQRNQPMPTFNLQNQPEHQNAHQSFRFRQNLQTNLNIEQGGRSNEHSSEFSEKISLVTLVSQSLKKIWTNFVVLRQQVTSKKLVKLNYLCAPKWVIPEVNASLTVPYHVY